MLLSIYLRGREETNFSVATWNNRNAILHFYPSDSLAQLTGFIHFTVEVYKFCNANRNIQLQLFIFLFFY